MTKKRLVIIGGAIVVIKILVGCTGEKYSSDAKSFLNALKRIIVFTVQGRKDASLNPLF